MTSTISSISAALRDGSTTSEALVEAALHSADEQGHLNAFISMNADEARAAATTADKERAQGKARGPLHGIPVAIKDNICTRGLRTTCASRFLEGFVPSYDATVVARLREGGAIVFGKTNCDEFAMGSSNENSSFGPVLNPRHNARVPGGSSGGSAAVVAADIVPLSLGSDTGGSVRQPAALCGVVGVKPTYGRVSRYGLVAFASSLDNIGPFGRTVKDTATVLDVIAGHDANDSTSADVEVADYSGALGGDVKGLKIGVPKEYFAEGLDAEVRARIESGLKLLESQGCEIVEISLPHTEYAVATYYLICTAEASANLARYDGVRYTRRFDDPETLDEMYAKTRGDGFGAEVTRRIILGTYVLSAGYYDAYYRKAQKVRALIAADFKKAFQTVDAIVTPVSPFPAFKLGAKVSDPLDMYLSDIYTLTSSLAGNTGISVPCGKTSEGLPIGLQILADHFNEATMLKLGDAFERAGGFEIA